MDVTTKAIALRATDYKENDKFVMLYSLEYGKISVHARGVRKGNAKLRYAADQFCFGNYELAVGGDRYTLRNCEQLTSFYSLREDIVAYYSACAVAECLLYCTEDGQGEPQVFVETLRVLEYLTDGKNPLLAVSRFILRFLEVEGFKLDFSCCSACGQRSTKVYLDAHRGVLCETCRTPDSIAASKLVSATCSLIGGIDYARLNNIDLPLASQKEVLGTLGKYISTVFRPLKSIDELIKLA